MAGDPPLDVRGDLISRCELFDEADLDAALARFDELNRQRPSSRTLPFGLDALIDALNRRDADGDIAGTTPDGRLDDRRKGLRALWRARSGRVPFASCYVPGSWRLETEPVASRGSRLSLTHEISATLTKPTDRSPSSS